MPKARKKTKAAKSKAVPEKFSGPGVRPLWSGTITFGLVSIPVDLMAAIRPRQTAMKLIDAEGHALGRQYHCSKEGRKLNNDDLVRGYQADDGKMVVITDAEFESVAPEMSADINLQSFVPTEQIPPLYFQKPYYLAPAGKSSKAYNLLVAIMESTKHVGIGNFVMRGHEYLVAIVSDNGVLRADTLRYADEIRTPESLELPKFTKPSAKLVDQFGKEIVELKRDALSMTELEDKEADELHALVKSKQRGKDNVIHQTDLEADDDEVPETSAKIIDLMAVLRRSLSKRAVVTSAGGGEPISLEERRAMRQVAAKSSAKKKTKTSKKKRSGPR
ncbi:MAG: Ku protein [Steroidobacteraceae bacterium]